MHAVFAQKRTASSRGPWSPAMQTSYLTSEAIPVTVGRHRKPTPSGPRHRVPLEFRFRERQIAMWTQFRGTGIVVWRRETD